MSVVINNNLSALKANRYLGSSNNGVTATIERLSSGYRINKGADDPSGLVISEQLRSQISGLNRAVQNSNEASNVISIAEGALNEMNEILKTLRALAIHASNNGVTSPEQVEADQAEMDSGLDTINRIANTTKYSDQNLLNGSKELVYDINTVVNEPTDHSLLDSNATRVDQIFKTSGVVMNVSHNGYKSENQADSSASAQRAYLECDNAYSQCQVNGNTITADQKFILTGTQGSKQFTFPAGETLGTVVSGINNSKDSTGVGANLIFASDTRIDNTSAADNLVYDGSTTYEAGDIQVYGADITDPNSTKVAGITITDAASASFTAGENCDGDGKIYAKVVDVANGTIEYYKDRDCTMLIGTGNDAYFSPASNSGIPGLPDATNEGIYIELTDRAENLDVYEIALVGQQLNNQKDISTDVGGWVDVDNSVLSGVNLGYNTDQDGTLHIKYTPVKQDNAGTVLEYKIEVFSDDSMESKYLVASSGVVTAATDATGNLIAQTVSVESVTMENGKESNLNMTIVMPTEDLLNTTGLPEVQQTGTISFTNLGIRLYSTEYGGDEYIRMQNQEGQLFYYYDDADTLNKTMVSGETTIMRYGQDAQVTLNGSAILTNGLVANATTTDFTGRLAFNSGGLGLTTIAVAGYDSGSLYSRAQALQAIEENETSIKKDDRYFTPMSVVTEVPGLIDTNNNDTNLYIDFSALDSSVKEQLGIGTTEDVGISYDGSGRLTLTLGTSGLSASFNINPDSLYSGIYISDTDLKGLYVKSTTIVDVDGSTATATATSDDIDVTQGDVLTEVMTYATNPRSSTTETLSNFVGGMQFQLGNSSGDQDRTVYSVQSMDTANLGQVTVDGTLYSLQDIQGGSVADLSRDPILAMKIIEQAVDDVTNLRARLGAFQSNMLQTNINSLEVAVENITLTESAIRDSDMAAETTDFTKYQIMSQASTSMLAQANQLSQNVLTLLQ